MLRKSKLVIALSLLTNACFSGLYLGGAIGPEGAMFTQRAHVLGEDFDVIDTNHFAGTGGFISLFAGYGCPFYRYYLAGEVNANLSSVRYELTNDERIHANLSQTIFTVRHSEGIGVLPGVFLSESLLFYGRIGYANGRVNISESDPTIGSSIGNYSGIRYGLGLRYALCPCWIAMMDYSQINYQSIHSLVFEPIGGVLKETQISPNTAQVAFGLMYTFDAPLQEKDMNLN